MAKRHFLLVANGDLGVNTVGKIKKNSFDKIVAADGGTSKAVQAGIVPEVVIGDLDSCPDEFFTGLPNTAKILKPSQEINDLEKALSYCINKGADSVTAVGITGGQIDHELNNFSVLAKYCDKISLTVVNDHSTILIIRNQLEIKTKPGQIISLIPWGKAEGITTRGLRYPLNNESLQLGVREGARNEATEQTVEVRLRRGTILLIIPD